MKSTGACSTERPWPGLFSYTEADAGFFFGRTRELTQVSSSILANRTTVIFGPSGTGKTSLLQAGVFPGLREKAMLPITVRPLEFSRCANSLCTYVKSHLRANCLEEGIELDEERLPPLTSEADESLWEYLQRVEMWGASLELVEPVLVFDQFEEWMRLFAIDDPATHELADVIENYVPHAIESLPPSTAWGQVIASRNHPWRVVLCLREDCIGQLEDLSRRMPSVMRNRIPLRRMTRQQGHEVILGPGADIIHKEMAERLLDFAVTGGPPNSGSNLPSMQDNHPVEPAILSLICRELNERRITEGTPQITAPDMEEAGGQILHNFYKQCFSSFRSLTAQCFVEDYLIDPSITPGRTFATDAQAINSGVRPDEIEHLIGQRLLRRETRQSGTHLELSHDVLIQPVKESRDSRLEQLVREEAKRTARELKKLKRQRQAIAYIFAITVVALVISVLAVFAVIQRKEADRQRRLVELKLDLVLGAIDKLIYQIPDQLGKLPGSIPIISRILEENLDLMQRLLQFNPDSGSPRAQRNLAANHLKLGDRWLLIGDTKHAISAYGEAEKLLQTLDQQQQSARSQRDIAYLNERMGSALLRRGDIEDARQRYQTALSIDTALFSQHPDEVENLRSLAVDYQHLGDVAARVVDHPGALTFYTQFLLAAERLADRPGTPMDRRYLATSQDKLALVHGWLGNLQAARWHASNCVELTRSLANDVHDLPFRRDFVTALQRLGNLQKKMGDPGQALMTFREMEAVARQLPLDPANLDTRFNHALAMRQSADCLVDLNRVEEALAVYDETERVFRGAILGADPEDHTVYLQLAEIFGGRAWAHALRQELNPAIKDYLRCIDTLETIPEISRDKVVQNKLMAAHTRVAKLLDDLGDVPGRNTHWQAAGHLFRQQYGDTFPVEAWTPVTRGLLFHIIGESNTTIIADLREDEADKHKAVQASRTRESLRAWNMTCASLATALADAGQLQEAAQIYAQMLATASDYLKNNDDAVIRGDLAYSYLKQGELLKRAGDRNGALQALTSAHALFKKVAAGQSRQFNIVYGLATIQRALADECLHHAASGDNLPKRLELAETCLGYASELIGLDGALLKTGKAPGISGMTILQDAERIARLCSLIQNREEAAKSWKHVGDLSLTLWGDESTVPARALLLQYASTAADGMCAAGQPDQAVSLIESVSQRIEKTISGPADFAGHQHLASALGNLCWLQLLAGNGQAAMTTGSRAVALIPNERPNPARLNLAHAYLLSGSFDHAKGLHEKYSGTVFEDGRHWNSEVRNDFRLLREAGFDHPDFKKIEAMLKDMD